LIPISFKNKILEILIKLENLFQNTEKLKHLDNYGEPVAYIEHMSDDTLGVARSHLGWMNFKDSRIF
jgi:hypothetical protein